MRKQNIEASGNQDLASYFNGSRRDFLKTFSAVSAGGLSSLLFPKGSDAEDSMELLKTNASQNTSDEFFWWLVRLQFPLDRSIIYMQTGTEGAMAYPVLRSLYKYTREFTKSPYYHVALGDQDSDPLHMYQNVNCLKVAEFLGARADEIVMTINTTDGVHMAINGLDLGEGDEIIMNLHDHQALRTPILYLRDRRGVVVKDLALPSPPTDKQEIIDLYENAITEKTKVMALCHINFTTGLRMPVKDLCQLATNNGIISVVDGAHAPGMIALDLHDLGCDFYACSGHKWLNGPPGTGIFYLKGGNENPHNLWPTLSEAYPESFPTPLQVGLQVRGQLNTPAFTAMVDAINFIKDIGGIEKLEARILALNSYLKEKVVEMWGEDHLYTPRGEGELCTGLAGFNPFKDPEAVHNVDLFSGDSAIVRALIDRNLHIRYTYFRQNPEDPPSGTGFTRLIRVSTHLYTNYREIDTALSMIKEEAEKLEG